MSKTEKLLKYKKIRDEAKEKEIKVNTQLETVTNNFKEYDCEDIDEMKEKEKEISKELAEKQKELETGMEEIEDKYDLK